MERTVGVRWECMVVSEFDVSCNDLRVVVLVVVGCGLSGVLCVHQYDYNIEWKDACISGNVTSGRSNTYLLYTCFSSSKIQSIVPLTNSRNILKNNFLHVSFINVCSVI